MQRSRPAYALLFALAITIGWNIRKSGAAAGLPQFLIDYAPDTMWALMTFALFGFLWPRLSTVRLAVYSLAFAFAIEFSQLYHAPGIDAVRKTLFGKLVLGSIFIWSDLLCYIAGVALGCLLERTLRPWKPQQSQFGLLTAPSVRA